LSKWEEIIGSVAVAGAAEVGRIAEREADEGELLFESSLAST